MSQLQTGINKDYLLSDVLVVSARATAGSMRGYTASLTRVRDPENPLPIPAIADERFGQLTYETRRTSHTTIDVPEGCPEGFEYRIIDIDKDLDASTCSCP